MMDFFDTDKIEGKKLVISERNVEEAMASKLMDHKLQALEYLNGKNALKHFSLLLAAAKYPIKQISEEAYRIILKMLPRKYENPELNSFCLELLLTNIVPWVNDMATRFRPQDMGLSPEDFEITVSLLNQQICECFDFFSVSLEQDQLNDQVLKSLKASNFKVQIAGCQLIKHFYLNVQDKTLLELAEVLDCLISNSTGGTKDVKKHSLQAIMAIYRVFGDSIDEFIDKLNNSELITQIKIGASQLTIKEEKKLPMARKSLSQRQLLTSNNQPSLEKDHGGTMGKSRSSKSFTPASVIPLTQIYFFDAYQYEQASDVLQNFDDKWVKKVQIIKKEEILLEELSGLIQVLQTQPKITYFPDVNKNFLLQLKNFLIDSNKKVVSLTITALNILLKATARQLQDGFMLFYPELIDKLRSKTKQDKEVYECLIYLSSNVSLANFLRRIQKDFTEKSSVLRLNLIQILQILFSNKANYNEAELIKAGNVLTELRKFAETELTKDLSVQVRKGSEKLSSVILENFSECLKAPAQDAQPPQSETGARKSQVERKSYTAGISERVPIQERKSERAMAFSGSNITESILVPNSAQKHQSTLNPSLLPPMAPSHNQTSQFSSLGPSGRFASMRYKRKESLQERGSERSIDDRQSHRSSGVANRDDSSVGFPGVSMITENTDFITNISVLEKQQYSRRDQINKGKLTSAFISTVSKALTEQDIDRLFVQLLRVKDDLGPGNLVSILKNIYESMEYFPPTSFRPLLPVLLRFSELNLKNNESSVAKRKASANRGDLIDSDIVLLMDYFLEYFGPMYFFEVFEETLYERELFQSVEAEPLLSLFKGLLIKVPANLHPVSLVLSIIRGFIYLHGSPHIWTKLEELVYVVSNVYGKENFRYIKKDFEVVGLKERVVDVAEWQLMTKFKKQESLKKLGSMTFKEKMISAAKDVSLVVKTILSSQSPKGDIQTMKEIIQICTRNFIYVIGDKENAKMVDWIVQHLADSNLQVQKMALQVFVLHFNSAKTTFKFGPVFFTNFGAILRSNNSELRSLAVNICFYVAKVENKVFKLVINDLAEASEDSKEQLANLALKLMKSDDKFLKNFELNSGLESILHLLLSKRQSLREVGEKLVAALLSHFERKDFVAQINSHKVAFRKQLMEIIDEIILRKERGETNISPGKSEAGNFLKGTSTSKEFVIRNINQISLDIAKCKSLKDLKQYSENHLSPELLSELFDVNSKKVLLGVSKIKDSLTENQMLAVKSDIFIFKLMNLLIEAETKQNDISTSMAEVVTILITIRKNASMDLYKQEKWALCEFLLALYKTRFDKKMIRKCAQLSLSLFQKPEEKEGFVDLIEKCNSKLAAEYFSGGRNLYPSESTVADSKQYHQSVREGHYHRESQFSLGGEPFYDTKERNKASKEFSQKVENHSEYDEDEGSGIDPNLEEFHNAIGDESSIKYEPYESPGKDQLEIHDLVLPDSKHNNQKGLMSSSSSNEHEFGLHPHHTFENRSSPVFATEAQRNQEGLDSPVFGSSKIAGTKLQAKQASFNLKPMQAQESEVQSKERRGLNLPPLGSPAQGPIATTNLNDQFKITKKPALKTSASKADINIKKASTGDQHRSYDSAGAKKLQREASKASLSRNSIFSLPGASVQFELNTFEDAIKVLNEHNAPQVAEAIVILRDMVDEIDSNQLRQLVPALNNFLEQGTPSDRVMGNILDLLIDIFKSEDLEQINSKVLFRNVGPFQLDKSP